MDDLVTEKIQFLKALDALVDYHNLARARIGGLGKKGGKQMNWLSILLRGVANIPLIVAGIEQIHGEALAGAQKKQMAMDALGFSAAVAASADPGHQQMIQAAASLASQTIDGVVTVMNAAKAPRMPIAVVSSPNAGQKPPQPVSVLAPQPETAPAGSAATAPSTLDPNPPAQNSDISWP